MNCLHHFCLTTHKLWARFSDNWNHNNIESNTTYTTFFLTSEQVCK